MSDDATPRLSLPYLAAAQAQKHVTLNQSLSLLDGLVQTAVESRTVRAEPVSPPDGALYLLPADAAGADWAGHAPGTMMRFEGGAWAVLSTEPGWIVYVKDEGIALISNGAGWGDLGLALRSLANLDRLGVGTTADAGNPFAVRAAAVLFDNAGGGVQVKIDKHGAGDNASILYQTGYSGRAEMGLCGDDDFHIKVSPDGSNFTDAVVIEPTAGRVGLGVSAPTSRLQVDGAVRVKSSLQAALPSAVAEGAGAILHVSDAPGGAGLAVSDGSAWRPASPRAGALTGVHAAAALIGDSRAKNFFVAPSFGKDAQNPLTWALGLMGQRLRVVYNGGVSGARSDQWQTALSPWPGYGTLNNLAALIASNARWVFVAGVAVNDIGQGFTAAQVWAGYNGAPGLLATLNAIAAAGRRIVIFEETGATSFTAAEVAEVHRLNRLLRAWVQNSADAIFFPIAKSVWSPGATGIGFNPGYTGDGVHTLPLGAFKAGEALAEALSPLIPAAWDEEIICANQIRANGGVNVAPNPLFLTVTGGTTGAGVTGVLPAGGTCNLTGGAGASVSVIPDPHGFGNAVQVVATFAASGDAVDCYIDLGTTGFAPGEIYEAQARVEVAAGSVNLAGVMSQLQIVYDGYSANAQVFDFYHNSYFGAGPSVAYALDHRTDRLALPAFSTVSEFHHHLIATAVGAGSATFTFSRQGVIQCLNA